jgi:hypothetical protein
MLETPEGHTGDFGDRGELIGVVLLNMRWTLERDGAITLTWPAERLDADQLKPAFQPPDQIRETQVPSPLNL